MWRLSWWSDVSGGSRGVQKVWTPQPKLAEQKVVGKVRFCCKSTKYVPKISYFVLKSSKNRFPQTPGSPEPNACGGRKLRPRTPSAKISGSAPGCLSWFCCVNVLKDTNLFSCEWRMCYASSICVKEEQFVWIVIFVQVSHGCSIFELKICS